MTHSDATFAPRLVAHGSGLAARGSRLGARGSGYMDEARGSGLAARGSGLAARVSRLGAWGSGLVAKIIWMRLAARGLRLGARGSRIAARGSWLSKARQGSKAANSPQETFLQTVEHLYLVSIQRIYPRNSFSGGI